MKFIIDIRKIDLKDQFLLFDIIFEFMKKIYLRLSGPKERANIQKLCDFYFYFFKNVPYSSFQPVFEKNFKVEVILLNLTALALGPSFFVPRLVSDLRLDYNLEKPTLELLNKYTANPTASGKSPKGVAAAALYFICKNKGIKISRTEFVKIVGITASALRARLKEMD